jgi:predicted RNase H-like HicB family nuclease
VTIKEYLERPYTIVIRHINDESGSYYFAAVREFDGCISDGETYAEAFENIQEAMDGWIEAKLAGGFSVPDPIEDNRYSDEFNLRIPQSLHARLAAEAAREGVSLNQYAVRRLGMQAGQELHA